MSEQGDAKAEEPYSKAFETLVENDDDVTGLLAYAYWKQIIREKVQSGTAVPGASRALSPTEVKMFRANADTRLVEFARKAIEEATPEIQTTSTANLIHDVELAIKNHVDARTGFWGAIVTSTVGWLLSIAITVLFFMLFASGTWGDYILNGLKNKVLPPPPAISAPSAG